MNLVVASLVLAGFVGGLLRKRPTFQGFPQEISHSHRREWPIKAGWIYKSNWTYWLCNKTLSILLLWCSGSSIFQDTVCIFFSSPVVYLVSLFLQNTPYPQGGMGLLNNMSYAQPSAGYGYQSPMVRRNKHRRPPSVYLFFACCPPSELKL